MFASRFFNPRYWASRYWPKVGLNPPISGKDCFIGLVSTITDEDTGTLSNITDSLGLVSDIAEDFGLASKIQVIIQVSPQGNVTQATLVGAIITLSTFGEPVGIGLIGTIDASDTGTVSTIDDSPIGLISTICEC